MKIKHPDRGQKNITYSRKGVPMSCLYITENGSKVAVKGGHFIVECQDGSERLVPKETLESIVIFGNVYLTVPCFQQKENILGGLNQQIM